MKRLLFPLCLWLLLSPAYLRAETGKLPSWTDNEIHAYADAAACENGGGETKYLPKGIGPNAPEAKDIPREWNGKAITWDNQNKRWLVGGHPTKRGHCSKITLLSKALCIKAGEVWIPGYPEDETELDGAKSADGTDLKCDRAELTNPSCVPYSKLYQKDVDGIRWSAIFRRKAAPVYSGPVAGMNGQTSYSPKWGDYHASAYYSIEVGGYNLSSRAATWLDTARKNGAGPNGADNRYDIGFVQDPANNFPDNTGTMPRPGGLRPWTRNEGARASRWWDTPAMLRTEECTSCHGSFFNGTDSLAKTGHPLGTFDDDTYWHAGNDILGFTSKKFFDGATHLDTHLNGGMCFGCHKNFMQNPSGELLSLTDFMTGDLSVSATRFSDWRLDKIHSDPTLKNASITHAMPKGHGFTVTGTHKCSDPSYTSYLTCVAAGKTWNVDPGPDTAAERAWLYQNAPAAEMVRCCQSGSTSAGCSRVKCENLRDASPPKFIVPLQKAQMSALGQWPPTGEVQEIRPPDVANAIKLISIPCADPKPEGFSEGDLCYKLSWEDSAGSPFNAPREFYWNNPTPLNGWIRQANAPDWTQAERDTLKYCPGPGNTVPRTSEAQITTAPLGNRWRFSYASTGLLKKCTKMAVHFCGGWCAGPGTKGQPATDPGTFLTVSNGVGCPLPTPTPTAVPTSTPTPVATVKLQIEKSGTGTGTVNSNPMGILCRTDCEEDFPKGSLVTLATWPDPGSVFTGWSGAGCSGAAPTCTVTMDQAKIVTASFNSGALPVLSVTKSGTGAGTVNSNPPGIDCGEHCSEGYPANALVTIKAWPQAGSVFLGWNGACSGTTDTCTVTMAASKTANANFSAPTAPPTTAPAAKPAPAAGARRRPGK